MDNHSNDLENKKISHTIFIFPIFMVLIMSLVKLIELKTNTNLAFLGVFPKNIESLPGVILSPFIHGSEKHLFNNILPLFFLSAVLKSFFISWYQVPQNAAVRIGPWTRRFKAVVSIWTKAFRLADVRIVHKKRPPGCRIKGRGHTDWRTIQGTFLL